MTTTMTNDNPTVAELGVKVGDFFVSSWGYDQTNVDFYKVVGTTAKSVKVQRWSSVTVETGGPHDRVMPGESPATWIDWSGVDQGADYWTQQEQKVERDARIKTKRVRSYGGDAVFFTVSSYANARKWDGRPTYQTGRGYGH